MREKRYLYNVLIKIRLASQIVSTKSHDTR